MLQPPWSRELFATKTNPELMGLTQNIKYLDNFFVVQQQQNNKNETITTASCKLDLKF